MPKDQLKLSDAEEKLTKSFAKSFFHGLRNKEDVKKIFLNRKRAAYQFSEIKRDLPINLSRKKILELGSGSGMFLQEAEQQGLAPYGIEPDKDLCKLAKLLLDKKGLSESIEIKQATAEKLPYDDNLFDVVTSFQVLEHVQDPTRTLQETVRVVKPGGYIYFVIPNYNSFWEGHYKTFWLPNFYRPAAKLYVKMQRKNPDFLDDINYITPKYLRRVFEKLPAQIVDLGFEKWKDRMISPDFKAFGGVQKMKKVAQNIRRLQVHRPLIKLGQVFEWYYPIVLLAQKNK